MRKRKESKCETNEKFGKLTLIKNEDKSGYKFQIEIKHMKK